MGRPYLPKTLEALKDYALQQDGQYVYTLKQICEKHGLTVPTLSRAAHKHGLGRKTLTPRTP